MDTHTPTLAGRLKEACHVAVSELPSGTHVDDVVDCVFGQISEADCYGDNYPAQFAYVLYWLHQYGVDISSECRGHEPDPEDNGPMGISTYCNGLCEARRTL